LLTPSAERVGVGGWGCFGLAVDPQRSEAASSSFDQPLPLQPLRCSGWSKIAGGALSCWKAWLRAFCVGLLRRLHNKSLIAGVDTRKGMSTRSHTQEEQHNKHLEKENAFPRTRNKCLLLLLGENGGHVAARKLVR
jgi:hypothetical protein